MFDPTRGAARELIDREEAERLLRLGALITQERRRPLYFDGRFLTASDLTREQNYFLSRQAALGRAGGAGVVQGLLVSQGANATTIRIGAGHGITTLGEPVVLPTSLPVNLADVSEIQRLDRAFGLLPLPREPARNLSGLYIVVLRPVEFSANPVAAYPTTIDGKRSVEDGDIVEATAVSLIPFADNSATGNFNLRRAMVARQLFLEGAPTGVPAGALPLAMIALDRNVIQWIDNYLVRREVGAEHGDVLGLGFAPRVLREAHILQYHAHLDEIMNRLSATDADPTFSAAEHFRLLPSAGRLPRGAVNANTFVQSYFPVAVEVELSIIPEDELPVLVEESLFLPPIDLEASSDEQASTSVMILVPVPRPNLRLLKQQLQRLTRRLAAPAPNLHATFKPIQALEILKQAARARLVPQEDGTVDAEWRAVLTAATNLWYVRRRNLAYNIEVVGEPINLVGNEVADERVLTDRLRNGGLTTRFANVRKRSSTSAAAEIVATLSAPKFAASRTLLEGALHELEGQEQVDRVAALRMAQRFAEPNLGEGVARLENANANLKNSNLVHTLAQSGVVPELDRLARSLPTVALPALAAELESVARAGSPQDVAAFVKARSKG